MAWLLLTAAIVAEVTGTVALRLSDGFSRLVPSVVVAVGYVTAFVLLSLVLQRGMPIGVAYGVWAAAGVALIAIIGAVFLGDHLTWLQGAGIVLVACGVLALEFGGAH
jgi:small multidrug resistance pump